MVGGSKSRILDACDVGSAGYLRSCWHWWRPDHREVRLS